MPATKTTPAYIGGGAVVHALAGEFTAAGLRADHGSGIGVDSLCGARRRIASRTMFLPTITLVTDGAPVSCSRCIAGARRRSAVTPVVETIDERQSFDAAEAERLQRDADEQTAAELRINRSAPVVALRRAVAAAIAAGAPVFVEQPALTR